jgi:hypothetical protein
MTELDVGQLHKWRLDDGAITDSPTHAKPFTEADRVSQLAQLTLRPNTACSVMLP